LLCALINDIGELALHNNDLWIGTKQGHICKLDTTQLMISVNEVISEEKNITVYLNPDNSYLTLKSSAKLDASLFLYTVDGKLMTTTAVNNSENSIQVKNYPAGIYFYQLISRNGSVLKNGKLVINNF
jgi:hypothetical protein